MARKLTQFLVGSLCLLLLISLIANWLLFNLSQDYYANLNATRLDPLGLSYFPDKLSATEPDILTAVFFGDSRAAQWPAPNGLSGIRFINRGIGAQTSTQIAGRFDTHIRPLQPDVIIIQMCINDLKTIPLFPKHRDQIVANCEANIQEVVAKAAEMEATIIVTTVFPVGTFPLARRIYWSPEILTAVNDVNRTIKGLEAQNVIVLDTYALLADETGRLDAAFARDELHLSDIGYTQLEQPLLALLNDQIP